MPHGRVFVPTLLGAMLALALAVNAALAKSAANAADAFDQSQLAALEWRNIGPSRGGRVTAVTGVPGQRNLYYFGGTGSGVWHSTDSGHSWDNLSDGWLGTGSVGAIAAAPSDPNVLYAGMGEACIRGNVSHGDGVYRSTDAGRSWKHVGLRDSRQIGRVRVNPRDADIVYVAALGHTFGPNAERGVYRSRDGGTSWKRMLFVNDSTGAVDLVLDPRNPRTIYAATWQTQRTPWSLSSGGAGSGLWKSNDAGDTWTRLTGEGLPKGVWGRVGVTVSPANTDRVWAAIEAEEGGIFRSDDAGRTWTRTNEDRKLRQRAWYYTHILADPKSADVVYVLNVYLMRSRDGGRTFQRINSNHGDYHDLWIDPDDSNRMVVGDDGGTEVSTDGGRSWTDLYNQPTAQFYHVITDDQFPYRVYGAQQDNSTIGIASRTAGAGIGARDWTDVGGGESGTIAPKPGDPNIVYAGSYGGYLSRRDLRTGQERNINPWPDDPMGWGAEGSRYRFQWTFPIVASPHDTNTIYAGSN
ncbi:MAG: glycosyl hydrolase, partial [Candidatus Eisenbacteria bacterium]